MNNILQKFAWILIGLGIIILCVFIIFISNEYKISSSNIAMDVTGQTGDFIGGVIGTLFALSGTLFVVLTFNEQASKNKQDKKDRERELFDRHFFQMLQLHEDYIHSLKINDALGREIFPILLNDLREYYKMCEELISEIIEQWSISQTNEYRKIALLYPSNSKRLKMLAHYVSYGLFFYGTNNYFIGYSYDKVPHILSTEIDKRLIAKRLPVFKGCHTLLAPYFRHLYHMVQMIEKNGTLDDGVRYEYSKYIRGRLGDFEQILLYYNSLSFVGENWIKCDSHEDVSRMSLLAKYRMIKNIPNYVEYFGITPPEMFNQEIGAFSRLGKDFFEIIGQKGPAI